MSPHEEVNQKMLELIHGLLPAEEAQALTDRIDADPELARLYRDVQAQAELFAKAARLEESRLELRRPDAELGRAAPCDVPHAAGRGARIVRWVVGIAATALLAVTVGGYLVHAYTGSPIADRHVRLLVAAPATLAAGVDNPISITTQTVHGTGVAAELELALYDERQNQLLEEAQRFVTTGPNGDARFVIPANVPLAANGRFEVIASSRGGRYQRTTMPLSVQPVRHLTRIALDRPWYKPGDVVRYRSVTLSSHALVASNDLPIEFEILDSGGASVAGSMLSGITERGVGNGEFQLPIELAGGQYTLVVRSVDGGFAEQRKQFLVRRYRLPRLKKELEFARDSYVPGEAVVADVAVNRAEGGPAATAAVRVIATVDGEIIYRHQDQLGGDGTYQVNFVLPDAITEGVGQLAVVVDDGGTRETVAKTIPINLGRVNLEFYPEGGDLVAGVANRIYFVARNPQGEPVEIAGSVVDAEGKRVAQLETVHEGRGVIQLAPRAGQRYEIEIDKPADARLQAVFPQLVPTATVVLTTAAGADRATGGGVVAAGEPLPLTIHSTVPNLPLVVTARCRGVQVGQVTTTTASQGTVNLTLPLGDSVDGVIRLTVYDYSGLQPRAIAERLVYRRSKHRLDVRVVTRSERYAPGDTVEVALQVTDEMGRAASGATLGVAVVDDALLSLARQTQRHRPANMPNHFRLASEIQAPEDLEDVDFYVDASPEAEVALDLLLGTQGWRRFVERQMQELPADGPSDLDQQRQNLDALLVSQGVDQPPLLSDNLAVVHRQYEAELSEYEERRSAWLAAFGTVIFGGGIFLVLVVAVLAIVRLTDRIRLLVPVLVTATACLLVGVFWMSRPEVHPSLSPIAANFEQRRPSDPGGERGDGRPWAERDRNEDNKLKGDKPGEDGAPEGVPEDEEKPAAALPPEPPGEPGKNEDANEAGEAFDEEGGRREDALREILGGQAADEEMLEEADFDPQGEAPGQPMLPGQKLGWLRKRLAEAVIAGDDADRKRFGYMLDRTLERLRLPIRQYAHQHVVGEPGVRSDFTETVYWNPLLIADADGRAHVRFDLSDAVTTFRLSADVHSRSASGSVGRIGAGGGEVVSRIPFSLQPKLPLEVNAGDLIDLPVAVVNDTARELAVDVALEASPLLELDGPAARLSQIAAGARQRDYFQLAVVGDEGLAEVTLRGSAGPHGDAVRQTIQVVPPGFPVSESYAGKIEQDEAVNVALPENWVAGSLQVSLQVYPSTLADLQKGLDGMLREPYGCFEQASTTNYPNVLALQYMQEHRVADPAFTRRAKALLTKGYARLTGYECKQKGYEWFGGDPGHEALTAYGLMEFCDMAAVYDVDEAMVTRTSRWLLARRDGKGGFQRNARALDSFGAAPSDITNAYIVWALCESGQADLGAELSHVVQLARVSDDPYVVALAAASAIGSGQQAAGRELLEKLKTQQQEDGHLEGTQGSITRSGGHSLKVETTALAALAWLKDAAFTAEADKAVDWLVASRQGSGGFGSTQATIMALKALVAHAKASRATVTGGDLIVLRDDQEIDRVHFNAGVKSAITIERLAEKLVPGENQLTLKLTGDNVMPYSLEVAYRTQKPVSDERCPVRLEAALADRRVAAGETVALKARLTNTTDQGQPMTLAVLGIPAGLTVRPDQLDELKRAGVIDYFETNAREVICYWRSLAPGREIDVQLDLVADIPGRYTAPASRAYLYYTAEQKWWVDPVSIGIDR